MSYGNNIQHPYIRDQHPYIRDQHPYVENGNSNDSTQAPPSSLKFSWNDQVSVDYATRQLSTESRSNVEPPRFFDPPPPPPPVNPADIEAESYNIESDDPDAPDLPPQSQTDLDNASIDTLNNRAQVNQNSPLSFAQPQPLNLQLDTRSPSHQSLAHGTPVFADVLSNAHRSSNAPPLDLGSSMRMDGSNRRQSQVPESTATDDSESRLGQQAWISTQTSTMFQRNLNINSSQVERLVDSFVEHVRNEGPTFDGMGAVLLDKLKKACGNVDGQAKAVLNEINRQLSQVTESVDNDATTEYTGDPQMVEPAVPQPHSHKSQSSTADTSHFHLGSDESLHDLFVDPDKLSTAPSTKRSSLIGQQHIVRLGLARNGSEKQVEIPVPFSAEEEHNETMLNSGPDVSRAQPMMKEQEDDVERWSQDQNDIDSSDSARARSPAQSTLPGTDRNAPTSKHIRRHSEDAVDADRLPHIVDSNSEFDFGRSLHDIAKKEIHAFRTTFRRVIGEQWREAFMRHYDNNEERAGYLIHRILQWRDAGSFDNLDISQQDALLKVCNNNRSNASELFDYIKSRIEDLLSRAQE